MYLSLLLSGRMGHSPDGVSVPNLVYSVWMVLILPSTVSVITMTAFGESFLYSAGDFVSFCFFLAKSQNCLIPGKTMFPHSSLMLLPVSFDNPVSCSLRYWNSVVPVNHPISNQASLWKGVGQIGWKLVGSLLLAFGIFSSSTV